jgi:hypothetical protein
VIDTDLERRKKKKEGGIIGMEFPRVLLSHLFFPGFFNPLIKWIGVISKRGRKRGDSKKRFLIFLHQYH